MALLWTLLTGRMLRSLHVMLVPQTLLQQHLGTSAAVRYATPQQCQMMQAIGSAVMTHPAD